MPTRIVIGALVVGLFAASAGAQESEAEKAARMITGGSSAPRRQTTPARSAQAAAPPMASSGHPAYYRMKRFNLMDEHGFERPIPAVTLLLPTDWKFQGEIQWGKGGGCTANMVQGGFRAVSADGRTAIEMFPGYNWQWTEDPGMRQALQANSQMMAQYGQHGCEIAPPASASDFLRRYVLPRHRASAQVIGIEPLPQVIQQLQQQGRQTEAAYARQGMKASIRADAARAHIQYSPNGQPVVEEWVTAVTVANGTLGPSYNVATGEMRQSYFYNCSGTLMFAERTLPGQLPATEKFFELVLSTVRLDPNWQNRVTQVAMNIQAAEIKGARDRSAIITKNNEEISKIIKDGYEGRQRSQDRMAQQFSQLIRGVESYRNPNTGETIELSNTYGNAWVNGSGEYLLTDQSSFDPNVALRERWTRLEHVK